MRSFPALVGLAAFLAQPLMASPQILELHLARPAFTVPDSRSQVSMPSQALDAGAIQGQLENTSQLTQFSGMSSQDHVFRIDRIHFLATSSKMHLQFKKRVVMDLPIGTTRKVIKVFGRTIITDVPTAGTKRVEKTIISDLPEVDNFAIEIQSREPVTLELPARIELTLGIEGGKARLRPSDPAALQKYLIDHAMALLQDASFDKVFNYQYRNLPGGDAGAALIGLFKGQLLAKLRDSVTRELSRPEFIRNFVNGLTQTFSAFPLSPGDEPIALEAIQSNEGWTLRPITRQTEPLPSDVAARIFSKDTPGNSASLLFDGAGLTSLVRGYLGSAPIGFRYDRSRQLLFYSVSSPRESEELSQFFVDYAPGICAGKPYEMAIELDSDHAPEAVPWSDEHDGKHYLDLKLGVQFFESGSERVAATSDMIFTFALENDGTVRLDRVQSPSNAPKGLFGLPGLFASRLKWLVLRGVINQKLAQGLPTVRGSTGAWIPAARLRFLGEGDDYSLEPSARKPRAVALDFQIK